MEVNCVEEDSQNIIRSDDTTKKEEDITHIVEILSSRFKLILVMSTTVAKNILTSEDITDNQQVIDPSMKVFNKLMDFYEVLMSTNPNKKCCHGT